MSAYGNCACGARVLGGGQCRTCAEHEARARTILGLDDLKNGELFIVIDGSLFRVHSYREAVHRACELFGRPYPDDLGD